MLKSAMDSYQKRFQKYGIHPKSLFWKNQKSISIRYQVLLKNLDLEGKSILEIGSGFGDVIPFIEAKTKNFTYLGLDLVPEFVKVSQMHFPKHRFKVHNILASSLNQKYDIVICSGALNSNLKNNIAFREQAIKTLWDHANEAVSFNMAGHHPQPKNKKTNIVYYADSFKISNYCSNFTENLILDQSYLSKDFTITMLEPAHNVIK